MSTSPASFPSSPSPMADAGDSPASQEILSTMICQWKGCSRLSHSSFELKTHIERDHLGANKGSYRCEWDGCTFGERRKIYDLKTHVTLHHQHLSHFCSTCKKGFLRDQELRKHATVGCPMAVSSSRSKSGGSSSSRRQHLQHAKSEASAQTLSPVSHAPSPISSDSGHEVPQRDDDRGYWSDQYLSDPSSPQEVPVVQESKKRQRNEMEKFIANVKREKIEQPTQTIEFTKKGNSIQRMSPSQLNSLLDELCSAPISGAEFNVSTQGLEFSDDLEEESLSPFLESIYSDPEPLFKEELDLPSNPEILSKPAPRFVSSPSSVSLTSVGLSARPGPPAIAGGMRTRSASKKELSSSLQVVPQAPSSSSSSSSSGLTRARPTTPTAPSFSPLSTSPSSFSSSPYLGQEASSLPTLAYLNSRALPTPYDLSFPYFGLQSPAASVKPSQISPPDDSFGQRRRGSTAGLSHQLAALSSSYLTATPQQRSSVRSSSQVQLPSVLSLFDLVGDKKEVARTHHHQPLMPLAGPQSRRVSTPELYGDSSKMLDLLQTLDIKTEEKDDNGVPPKPSPIPTNNISMKKPVEAPVQTAMRFGKQDFFGIVEKVLKRV